MKVQIKDIQSKRNMTNQKQKSKKQEKFEAEREQYSEREIQMEILYSNWLIQAATENTRANTSTILWIIIIGIIISIIGAMIPGI